MVGAGCVLVNGTLSQLNLTGLMSKKSQTFHGKLANHGKGFGNGNIHMRVTKILSVTIISLSSYLFVVYFIFHFPLYHRALQSALLPHSAPPLPRETAVF